MAEKTFSDFIKEEEAKSPFLSSLGDELGIDPSDMAKEPQIASFFSFGNTASNLSPYKIIKFNRDQSGKITHAVVRQKNDRSIKIRNYKDDGKGGFIQTETPPGENTFIVPIEELDKLMSQDFQPPAGGM